MGGGLHNGLQSGAEKGQEVPRATTAWGAGLLSHLCSPSGPLRFGHIRCGERRG